MAPQLSGVTRGGRGISWKHAAVAVSILSAMGYVCREYFAAPTPYTQRYWHIDHAPSSQNGKEYQKVISCATKPKAKEDALRKLLDSYLSANPDMVQLVNRVQSIKDGSFREVDRSLWFVSGVAGVGKSLIADELARISGSKHIKIDLVDRINKQWSAKRKETPELSVSGIHLGKVVGLSESAEETEDRLKSEMTGDVVILDDLDEVDFSVAIGAVNAAIMALDNGPAKCIIVFGRPEAIRSCHTSKARRSLINASLFRTELKAPGMNNIDTAAAMFWNWEDYNSGSPKDRIGGAREYSQVEMLNAMYRRPWLVRTAENLAAKNWVFNLLSEVTQADEQMQTRIFDYMMVRSRETHGRPKMGAPYWDLYKALLVEAAVAASERTDRDGYFDVAENGDHLRVMIAGNIETVDLWQVLDHSGLVDMAPFHKDARRYRFDPPWIQEFLVRQAPRWQARHVAMLGAALVVAIVVCAWGFRRRRLEPGSGKDPGKMLLLRAVVKIKVEIPMSDAGYNEYAHGTGFALEGNIVMTARHVVRGVSKIEILGQTATTVWPPDDVGEEACDVALLSVNGLAFGDCLPLSNNWIYGDDYSCSGYAQNLINFNGTLGCEAHSQIEVNSDVAPTSSRAWKGISGAPVLCDRGVVAIVTDRMSDDAWPRLLRVLSVREMTANEGFAKFLRDRLPNSGAL